MPKSELIRAAAKAALSTLPGGGIVTEISNYTESKRLKEWCEGVEVRLNGLEGNSVKIEDIKEEFATTLIQATLTAVKNHDKEKIDALRNAVLNTAVGRYPGSFKSDLFISFIDRFTICHLRVLKTLSHFDSIKDFRSRPSKGVESTVSRVIHLPELDGNRELATYIVEDLARQALLSVILVPVISYRSNDKYEDMIVTPLGKEFLAYIAEIKASD